MRTLIALLLVAGCTAGANNAQDPLTPTPNPDGKPAGAACTKGSDCKGGTCLGAPGQPEEGNNRFSGGYCTAIRCTPDSQTGCGADEWCVEAGEPLGGYCVEMCSKADGLSCDRADHVCLGLGTFGGCFSRDTVECNPVARTGCADADLCVKIGFEDHELGRCETACDPLDDRCGEARACYFIRSYNAAFCGEPGVSAKDEPCSCDKCCEPGLACTPDLDGDGRHCKEICGLDAGCDGGEQCVPLKTNRDGTPITPYGGCTARP